MKGKILGGRYELISKLGQGAFGTTFLALDRQLPDNNQCVVKQLSPKQTDPGTLREARRLFDIEAKVLNRLGAHDQIPRLLAHFEEAQEFYLVQEFIAGQDLSHEIVPGQRLSEDDTIVLMQDVLRILEFVHANNVIHRDIKPSNLIRRQQDGKIVLIDFGAVKEISSQVVDVRGRAKLTVAIGSRGYMASEQSQGQPRFSSDIYAVGMVGIQALTGLPPSRLEKDPETGEIIWRQYAQVSPALADVIDKMVRYHFSERYLSVQEVLRNLAGLSVTILPNLPPSPSIWANPTPSTATPLVPPPRTYQPTSDNSPTVSPTASTSVAPTEASPVSSRKRRTNWSSFIGIGIAIVATAILLLFFVLPLTKYANYLPWSKGNDNSQPDSAH